MFICILTESGIKSRNSLYSIRIIILGSLTVNQRMTKYVTLDLSVLNLTEMGTCTLVYNTCMKKVIEITMPLGHCNKTNMYRNWPLHPLVQFTINLTSGE